MCPGLTDHMNFWERLYNTYLKLSAFIEMKVRTASIAMAIATQQLNRKGKHDRETRNMVARRQQINRRGRRGYISEPVYDKHNQT